MEDLIGGILIIPHPHNIPHPKLLFQSINYLFLAMGFFAIFLIDPPPKKEFLTFEYSQNKILIVLLFDLTI